MDALFKNPHLVIPFLTYFIAQSVKMFLKASKGDFQWKYMFATGDMPSVHTAVAISLLVSLGFVEGVNSAAFAIGAVWALFIIYDSFNVRRAVGEQGGVIMRLIELSQAPKHERDLIKVREVLGHTPLEVMMGALTGLSLGFLLSYRYWPQNWQDALGPAGSDTERIVYYSLFGALFLLGFVLSRLHSRRRVRKLPTARRVRRLSRNAFVWPALFGALTVWLESENIRFFSNKVWIYFLLAWALLWGIAGYFSILRKAKRAMGEESSYLHVVKKQERKKRRHKRR